MVKAKKAVYEVLVFEIDSLRSPAKKILSKSIKNWTDEAVRQFNFKIKRARQSADYQNGLHICFDVNFTNGSRATFFFIPDIFSLFSTHEALRDGLSKKIRDSHLISFNLLGLKGTKISEEKMIDALSSLVVLSKWSAPTLKKHKDPIPEQASYGFYSNLPQDQVAVIIQESEIKARATNLTREIAATPHSIMGSKELVDRSVAEMEMVPESEILFYPNEQLKEMGAGAFTAVTQSSKSNGGIVCARRKGKGERVILIGKGLVYDTGGYNIKTDGMYGMHRDKTGAAVALSAYKALAQAYPEMDVSCYLAVAENLISPEAYKPGDIVKCLTGETIEIVDTDAEGRLVLADTIALATKGVKSALIIDFATLTGSAMDVAGKKWSVAMTKNENMLFDMFAAGQSSGERVVPMLISDEFADEVLNSEIADLSQCTDMENAEHLYAAGFLTHFSGQNEHIHVDLSSESEVGGAGLVDSDVTGFGIRWVFEFLRVLRSKGSLL